MEKCLLVQMKIMKLGGLWPINYDKFLSEKVKKYKISTVLNVVYYGLWYCIALHLAVCHIVTLHQKIHSGFTAEDIIMVLLQTYIYISVVLLMAYCHYIHSDIKEALEFLIKNFRYRSAPGISFVTMDECLYYTRKLIIFWLSGGAIGVLHWTIAPIISWDFSKLPFPIWYPGNVDESPQYQFAYIGQILGQLHVGLVYGCTSSLFVSFVFLTCGQFDIFLSSLQNIRNSALIKCGGHFNVLKQLQEDHFKDLNWPKPYFIAKEKPEILKQEKKFKKKEELKKNLEPFLIEALKDCFEFHLNLQEFCRKIEKLFRYYILLSATSATFLLCVLAYLASTAGISSFNLISVVDYFLLANMQWFLLCYWGQVIKNQVITFYLCMHVCML